jgi:hypothetical protein
MPTPNEKLLIEDGSSCDDVKITHSSKLQEDKSYIYVKRFPDDNNPVRLYVERLGNSANKFEPCYLRFRSGPSLEYEVFSDSQESSDPQPGYAHLIRLEDSTDSQGTLYEPQTRTKRNSEGGYILEMRSPNPGYNLYITDEEIQDTPGFKYDYQQWIDKRYWEYYDQYGVEPPAPEAYEITNWKQAKTAELKEGYLNEWEDWVKLGETYPKRITASYWTGAWEPGTDGNERGLPIYEEVEHKWIPKVEVVGLFREDGTPIGGSGYEAYVMQVYEFHPGDSVDIENADDWTPVFKVVFGDNPEPLIMECANCDEDCVPVYKHNLKICVCKGQDGEKNINDLDRLQYQAYHQNQTPINPIDYNP